MAAVPYRAGTMPDRPGTPQHRCCMPIAERNVAMRQVMLRAEGLAKGPYVAETFPVVVEDSYVIVET